MELREFLGNFGRVGGKKDLAVVLDKPISIPFTPFDQKILHMLYELGGAKKFVEEDDLFQKCSSNEIGWKTNKLTDRSKALMKSIEFFKHFGLIEMKYEGDHEEYKIRQIANWDIED